MGKYIPVEKKYFEEQKENRLGEENINHQGLKMKIIEYRKYTDIDVEFEDGTIITSDYYSFIHGKTLNKNYKIQKQLEKYNTKIGEKNINNQGYEMIIIEFNNYDDLWVEFQDNYHSKVHGAYKEFKKGAIKNPCHPSKYGQITGNKYKTKESGSKSKEYNTWMLMFQRVFKTDKPRNKTYEQVNICDDWYYYPNFYEWICKQPNYEKWKNNSNWAIDKDIFSDPNNKIYSPQTCCLVPRYINDVIKKSYKTDLPNGVSKNGTGYGVTHTLNGKTYFNKLEDAVKAYKEYKKHIIIEAAEKAIVNNDITKECYEKLLVYENY